MESQTQLTNETTEQSFRQPSPEVDSQPSKPSPEVDDIEALGSEVRNDHLPVEPHQSEVNDRDADAGLTDEKPVAAEENYDPQRDLRESSEPETGDAVGSSKADSESNGASRKLSHSSCESEDTKNTTVRPNDVQIAALKADNPLLDEGLGLTDRVKRICRHLDAERCHYEADANAAHLEVDEVKGNESIHLSTIAQLRQQLDQEAQDAQATRRHVETLTNQLHELQQTHLSTTTLLAARTKELTVAQQFLTTADSVAGADVTRLVERVNSEIFHCAANLADTMPPRIVSDTSDSDSALAADNARKWVGEPIIQLLQEARSMEDPSTVVQIAVQNCLVSYSAHFVNSWHHDRHIEDTFRGLYFMLRQTVVPQVASKWRALTKSNLDRLQPHGGDLSSDVITSMLAQLSAIVAVVGYLDGLSPSTQGLLSNLGALAKSLAELRSVIGEQALFSDMEAFCYPSGTPFDANSMEDTFGNDQQSNGPDVGHGPILCTTDLGLRESRVVKGEDEIYMEDIIRILLMPKVVLQSIVGEILGQG